MIPATSNSPTTLQMGDVTYTTTTSTEREKSVRLNSKRFSPLQMESANCGLIDNKTRVCFGESQDRFELLTGDPFEAPWGRFDIRYYTVFDEGSEVRAPRERVTVQELDDEGMVAAIVPPVFSKLVIGKHAPLST